MRTLTVGYVLSAINSFVFTLPTVMIYPALVLYPVSIVLRGLGWWRLRQRIGLVGVLSLVVWSLGLTCFGFVLAQFLDVFDQALSFALYLWAAYSVVEAVIYVAAGRSLGARLFYLSPVSLVGVASLTMTVVFLGSGVRALENAVGPTLYITTLTLFISAAASAAASARISTYPVSTPARFLPPSRLSDVGPVSIKASHSTLEATVETVRPGASLRCPVCKSAEPLRAAKCSACGYVFEKSARGLRCPTCSAPFSKAVKLPTQGLYICGLCSTVMKIPVRRQ
ncbi:MAG: hydrogenase maturation nickel metallochaperone HypA [Candidatus Caldarchaeum sp.]|nr:hydrogenase maturation nickel metallochaperone HypA [Candidatus Caldarchaeum sp.]